ncbi:MAG TPA: NAD-dependent epimerase/dehydratase family protein [Steroidobacteraceae bacterium]|nr:NAD-dependent epimerase/dehydratase family protein [Steroidobacteraceae bacterium]
MTAVLVTGATGLVGRPLCELLSRQGYEVRAALRTDNASLPAAVRPVVVGDIGSRTQWGEALDRVQLVVHCAARAHIMGARREESEQYMESNARGTEQLARACVEAGVQRFVYLSSVKVNGESTRGHPFSPADPPQPRDPYGLSKWAGETRLTAIAAGSAMEAAIVRSPLVYGPRVRANFLRLLRLVESGVPLPFGCIDNARSLVSVWNLCDLIERLLRAPRVASSVFMVCDGEDLSTPQLLRRIGAAMRRRVRLLPVPVAALRAAAALAGRREEVERLCGSLTVDISSTRGELGWSPPLTVDEGLARTVHWYLSKVEAS